MHADNLSSAPGLDEVGQAGDLRGSRIWRNVGLESLTYIVVQARAEGSLVRGIEDGEAGPPPDGWAQPSRRAS